MDCVWTIATPPDHVIIFTFLLFSLEGNLGLKCRYDYVQLFNGSSTSSPAMGVFCGRVGPPPLVSTTNFLTVRFYSDDIVSRRGFVATYRAIGTRSATAGGPP
ncbi:bone morphogenetic protein 1-like [Megalops cyprinoides]|uniref:bone morphogenetic protein 1-like n=1 Tax=Megalops cyprinoides TaxID=118141 RepID=UPI001863D369|nr:bone morphogenetic protein 1-like [Megalops cyprinoides]